MSYMSSGLLNNKDLVYHILKLILYYGLSNLTPSIPTVYLINLLHISLYKSNLEKIRASYIKSFNETCVDFI
jgi:hypothetical protein